MIETGLAHRGHDDPITRKVDGVTVALIDSRHVPPRKRAVEWVLGPFAFKGDKVLLAGGEKVAYHRVSIVAVYFDELFERYRIAISALIRPCVSKNVVEEVAQKPRQQFSLLERIDSTRRDHLTPL